MADTKYAQSGKAKTISDAVQMLLERDIVPQSHNIVDQWQGFREKEIWTLPVN